MSRHVPGDGRRHFDRRLVGLELDERLIYGDRVADLHQQAQDVAALHVLAQFRESRTTSRRPTRPPAGRTASGLGFGASARGLSVPRRCGDRRRSPPRALPRSTPAPAPAPAPRWPRRRHRRPARTDRPSTLSPGLTWIATTLPSTERRHLDRGLVGFELEDRLILRTVSPVLTRTRRTSPPLTLSPSSGTGIQWAWNSDSYQRPATSATPATVGLADRRILLLRMNLEILDRLLHDRRRRSSSPRRARAASRARRSGRPPRRSRAGWRGSRCGRSRRCRAGAAAAAPSDRSLPGESSCNRRRRRTRRAPRRGTPSRTAPAPRSPGAAGSSARPRARRDRARCSS